LFLQTPLKKANARPGERAGAHAVAHGLCAKHYMRLQRHGDVERTLKRGPKPLFSFTPTMREMFPEMSPRTFARYMQAMSLLHTYCDKETCTAAIKAAGRPNGSLNVSKLLAIAMAYARDAEEE
jgi:hypothetical protein